MLQRSRQLDFNRGEWVRLFYIAQMYLLRRMSGRCSAARCSAVRPRARSPPCGRPRQARTSISVPSRCRPRRALARHVNGRASASAAASNLTPRFSPLLKNHKCRDSCLCRTRQRSSASRRFRDGPPSQRPATGETHGSRNARPGGSHRVAHAGERTARRPPRQRELHRPVNRHRRHRDAARGRRHLRGGCLRREPADAGVRCADCARQSGRSL
jgi:hypothetical protein